MHVTPFLSWDFVRSGTRGFTDDGGSYVFHEPVGVRLIVEPCTKSGPVLRADKSWEAQGIGWSQVMRDQGVIRLWYGCYGEDREEGLAYAQSEDDGMTWTKPSLGLCDYRGSKDNNLVLNIKGCSHTCVFIDPTTPAEQRYRAIMFKAWWEGEPGEVLESDEGYRRLDAKNAAKPGEKYLPVTLRGRVFGLNSPDGLRWTLMDEHILDEWHDSFNQCFYDAAKKKYIGYWRGFYGGRRAVAYNESEDFNHMQPTRCIHHHVMTDRPDASLYSPGYTRYPGRDDIHLMFNGMYRQITDTIDGQLAVSMDGVNWSSHTSEPIIPCGKPGEPDQGSVYPGPTLITCGDGKMRLMLRSSKVYHNQNYLKKYQREEGASYYQWAVWDEHRLGGIRADGEGRFTFRLPAGVERLVANFRADAGGSVRFEISDNSPWPPLPIELRVDGFHAKDMQPLTGDQTHAPLTWRGSADLSHLKDRALYVTAYLNKATLFAVTGYGVDDPEARQDPRFPV